MNNEAKVLSAVLQDKQIHLVLQESEELFRTHKDVWQFIRDYAFDNKVLPPVNLVTDSFIDFEYVENVGTTKHHLNELKRSYKEDALYNVLRTAASKVQTGDLDGAVGALSDQLTQLSRVTSRVSDINASDIDSAVAHYEAVKRLNEQGFRGIKTGIRGIDDYLPGGILPGQFGVIMAYPGIGKSFMALYIAAQTWLNGKTPMIVSLEMTEAEVRNRLYAILAGGLFSLRKLADGQIDLDELRAWGEKRFADMPPFHIISNEGVGEVSPSVVRGKHAQYQPDLTVLDYIQLMVPDGKIDGNETVKVKNLSMQLKLMALSDKVPVLAIASATVDKDDVKDMESPPMLGQVAWSKQLAYDADFMISLGRQKHSNVINGVFRKNRNGLLGEFLVEVDFDKGHFRHKSFD